MCLPNVAGWCKGFYVKKINWHWDLTALGFMWSWALTVHQQQTLLHPSAVHVNQGQVRVSLFWEMVPACHKLSKGSANSTTWNYVFDLYVVSWTKRERFRKQLSFCSFCIWCEDCWLQQPLVRYFGLLLDLFLLLKLSWSISRVFQAAGKCTGETTLGKAA